MLKENLMVKALNKFDDICFLVIVDGEEYKIGEGEPTFTAKFKESIPVSKLLSSTSLALGEAYMSGNLEIEGDLYHALDYFMSEMDKFSIDKKAMKKLMSYSCGYFLNDNDTLYQAQVNKVDYILKKLYLKEGMTLLDIGCGWGFLLIEAAKKYKIHGTGITLSVEQYNEFRRRIVDEGLEDYLEVKLMDYRDLKNSDLKFDRVVSVGMLEHVGRDNYQLFIDCVNTVLKPHGLFLLHFISGLKEHPGDPWIKKYIFPGGVIPSLREIMNCLAEDNFHTLDVENLRNHYNRTLLCWEKNYKEHIDEVREMFDEEFVRMWDLYLSACAAIFHNGIIDIHQILVSKGVNNDLPIVRWY